MQEIVDYSPIQTKLIMVGDPGVGKTALVKQYVEHRFETDFLPTLGMEINVKELKIGKKAVRVAIWDLGGQDNFRFIRPRYYGGASGVVLVYDLTCTESYENLKFWVEDLKKICGDIPISLLGNKSDLVEKIENIPPDSSQLLPILQEYQERDLLVDWAYTSAKTSKNVGKAFKSLIESVLGEYS
ncbi:MAG: Rab family GTPase [Promethearchaeota archaeon]